jgi:hypothetical protein
MAAVTYFALFNLIEEVPLILIVERWVASKKNVGDDSNGPHIYRFPVGFTP